MFERVGREGVRFLPFEDASLTESDEAVLETSRIVEGKAVGVPQLAARFQPINQYAQAGEDAGNGSEHLTFPQDRSIPNWQTRIAGILSIQKLIVSCRASRSFITAHSSNALTFSALTGGSALGSSDQGRAGACGGTMGEDAAAGAIDESGAAAAGAAGTGPPGGGVG